VRHHARFKPVRATLHAPDTFRLERVRPNADNRRMQTTEEGTADSRVERRLYTEIAASADDVAAAQRLRYRVFAEELAAQVPGGERGLDGDEFDPHCDHLLVRDRLTAEVVGTYRVLSAARAAAAGRFYSETEFDLARVAALPNLAEVGRACIHPAYRNGMVLALLWGALAAHLRAIRADYVMGCASVPLVPDADAAATVCHRLARDHLAPVEWRVFPHRPFPLWSFRLDARAPAPTLVRGYLRMGAVVCGDPGWDPEFGTADLLLLLPMARMDERFVHRLTRAA
jgi:putative hemolysin